MKISILLAITAATFAFAGNANADSASSWGLNELNRCHQEAGQDHARHQKCTDLHKCVTSGRQSFQACKMIAERSVQNLNAAYSDSPAVTVPENADVLGGRSDRRHDLSSQEAWDDLNAGD